MDLAGQAKSDTRRVMRSQAGFCRSGSVGARRQFWKERLRGTKILFCGRGLNFFFTPNWGTNSKTTHFLSCNIFFFRLNTLKGTAKAPVVDLLRLNTPRATKTAFFNPPFFMEVVPGRPQHARKIRMRRFHS